jgi:hypothetical protein
MMVPSRHMPGVFLVWKRQSERHVDEQPAIAMTTNLPAGHSRVGRRVRRRFAADVAAAALLTGVSAIAGLAQEADTAAGIVAAQIRTQGYACAAPVSATRDRQASRPNVTVWFLRCGNASYRVQLVPDMAAQVTQLE